MQVDRCWILAAKQLAAQATEAELDELAGYTNLQAHMHVLTGMFSNTPSPGLSLKKDATNLMQRIHCINSYTNRFFTDETTH